MPEKQNPSYEDNSSSNAPKVRVSDYPIDVAGWENQHTRRSDGHEFTKWNFVLSREYKKDGEKVVEKMSIPADNILQVAALLQKAYAEPTHDDTNGRAWFDLPLGECSSRAATIHPVRASRV
ncbi:MAG: hypothetical protein H8E66_12205 [Planctomycetes bacterium]|nr:hypothetical protein [Planctomycetota bacterium]